MNEELSIRPFDIGEADWSRQGNTLSNIRRLVFVVELGLASEDESDSKDGESWHWLATDREDVPVGTVRLRPDGQIGELAVLENFRGRGIGAALLEQAVDKARHLGFTNVSLIVQPHTRQFYERVGFTTVGKVFKDSGITYQCMVQNLNPLDDNVQRLTASDSDPEIAVKQFDTREVTFKDVAKIIRKVREIVFVHELGLPESLTGDEADADAIHWVAQDASGLVIGVIRMSLDGEISRLAVATEHRNKGVGQSLLEQAVGKATRFDLHEVRLDALAVLDDFYTRAGFEKRGDTFDGFGLKHQSYIKTIKLEDVHEPLQRPGVDGDHYSESEIIYKLGQDKKFILLRREEDYKNVILEMAKQAITSVRIFSPVLEHKLFDNIELREILSLLARKNRYTHIEILLYDSHRVTRNGHALLDISRKLPSSIKMKIVHPEFRQLNHEYVLVDGAGIVYRRDYEAFDGFANFSDITECSRLGRQFNAAWESGLSDPNLRQLRM
ncbi:MAG: GNAT family N-acetyltransferase [Gammaproteobacteria bacterium]|nr:GNAT family N-acetyltransferase [Gammaproteobacteria bacterium]